MAKDRVSDVLDYWFLPPGAAGHGKPRDLWFASTPEIDAEMRARFGGSIAAAVAGRLDHWARTPRGALALCLLLDQMTRNTGRGTAAAFAGDARAARLARLVVARGRDRLFPVQMRKFFYLPFEHGESPGSQHRAIGLFAGLRPPVVLKWAMAHRDIVVRFGRFPHRNAALGRVDTPAERDYLAADHQRFGQ